MRRNRAFYGTLLFLFAIPICRAVLVNRTIDSNLGDLVTGFMPIYQPASQDFWSSQPCSGCYIQPDVAKAFDGTWNSAYYTPGQKNVNVTLRFTGVAIWVNLILANTGVHGSGLTTNTQVNITLDGRYANNYSHYPHMNDLDLTYNATVFAETGLANISHEIVIGTNDYVNYSYINFDYAIYTVDIDAPASQSSSQSSSSAATTYSSSIASTSSPTAAPQPSSSKTGVIVGSTLGGLAVIALVLVFLIRRSRRALPIRYEKAEGTLDIDVLQHYVPYHKRETVPLHELMQSKAARLREERQREINERILSAQRELDNLRPDRNAGSADSEIDGPSAAGTSAEMASLRNEMQQLRDQIEYLHTQRESDLGLVWSNERLIPDYPMCNRPGGNGKQYISKSAYCIFIAFS